MSPLRGIDWSLQITDQLSSIQGKRYAKEYFVDNTAANGDGGEATPFAQIASAVTAWEAYRLTLANVYSRSRITIKGTGTAYTALTALPSYCDMVGDGAEPWGDGTGIPVIGANGADGIAGTARGLGLYGLQFISGGAFWCADFVNLFRSIIKGCAFKSVTAATDGGIRFSGASGGLTIVDNHWMAANDVLAKVGVQASGTHLNSSRIQNNFIHGSTAGVLIDSTVKYGDNTVWLDNVIGDLGKGCVTAIDDNMPADSVGWMNYVKNSVMGTNLITIANNGAARCHGNVSANGFVAVTAS